MPDTPMTPERLAELHEAAEKATPGPWTWYAAGEGGDDEQDDVLGYDIKPVPEPLHERYRFRLRADAQLAAAAPELLAEVERLRAENLRLTVAADPSRVGKVGELVASATRLVRIERDAARAEADRLRPMEAALEAAEAEVQRLREWQMRVAEALGIYEPAGPGPEMCEQDPTRAAEYADMAADAVQERNDLVQEVEHKTAILEAIGKLHWPVEYAPDRPDICYTCCTDQAEDLEHGYRTCTVEKHKHTPGGPICPTRAALDGGA